MKALKETGIKKLVKFILFSCFISLFNLASFPPLRTFLLQLVGIKIGRDTIVHNIKFINAYRKGFDNLSIGKECFLGEEVLFDLADRIIIKDCVTIALRAIVLTHTNVGYKNHPLQKFIQKSSKSVVFNRGCFIGAGAIIMPGVTIGECAVVGAGAVVTRDITPFTVVAGSPAKKIKTIKRK